MERLRALVPALSGLLFALGLGLSGMTRPVKVTAFLDVFGAWDPSLAFVMGGAILVHLPFVAWLRRRRPGLIGPHGAIDGRLIAGAAVFGVGWGLSGLCPGPAFVALAGGSASVAIFVVCLFVGIALANALLRSGALTSATKP